MREHLERLRDEAHRERYVERDPLSTVIRFSDPGDQEVGGLIAALLAYGQVDLLRAHAQAVLDHLGEHPAERLRAGVPTLPAMAYRFHRTRDLTALLCGIRSLLLAHGSLGAAFSVHWDGHEDLRRALTGFVHALRDAAGPAGPGLRFLLADPAGGGACKRWHLYLRWMVRQGDGDPDPGPWRDRIPASSLLVPLDTHLDPRERQARLHKAAHGQLEDGRGGDGRPPPSLPGRSGPLRSASLPSGDPGNLPSAPDGRYLRPLSPSGRLPDRETAVRKDGAPA